MAAHFFARLDHLRHSVSSISSSIKQPLTRPSLAAKLAPFLAANDNVSEQRSSTALSSSVFKTTLATPPGMMGKSIFV